MNSRNETIESYFEKLKVIIKGSLFQIIGALVGGVAGFIYYYKVGCSSGTCAITSNPWLSTLWGILMGYLLIDIFRSKRKK